jgi:hypothetical protein
MAYTISYTSILFTEARSISRFGGSSKYKVIGDELMTVQKSKKSKTVKQSEEDVDKEIDHLEEISMSNVEHSETERRIYRLNKSKVKKKCHALSRLEKSKKFMAFYSISFPVGLPDETAYRIFNTWLTRCRKNCSLKTYLWVAERQKNGTIHYHLLTNDSMPIQQVNGYMAKCLLSEQLRGCEALKTVNTDKYNGVDVKRVGKDKKGLIGYLAKYVTKNTIEFYRLPWHCSRDVSRLFTSINFEEPEGNGYFDQLPERIKEYNFYKNDYYRAAGFKFTPKEEIYNDLDYVNEAIYN